MIDAATMKPVRDVVVSVTSPAIGGSEAVTVTGPDGDYTLVALPEGTYSVRFESPARVPKIVSLDLYRGTVRQDAELVEAPEVTVSCGGPGIDVSSTTQGVTLGHEFIDNVPVGR